MAQRRVRRRRPRDRLAPWARLNTSQTPSGPALVPGRVGFSAEDHPDGQVLNLSYWVFPAFDRLKGLGPETDWSEHPGDGPAA